MTNSDVSDSLQITMEIDKQEYIKVDKDNTISNLTILPISRVKLIVKSDPDISIVAQEAVILIAKSTV